MKQTCPNCGIESEGYLPPYMQPREEVKPKERRFTHEGVVMKAWMIPDSDVFYKITTGKINQDNPHMYCTINYLHNNLKEVFLSSSSKNSEMLTSIGRLCSLILRSGIDTKILIDELKAVKGDYGYFTSEFGFIASVPQHIGYVLEEVNNTLNNINTTANLSICPACGKNTYVKENGCGHCIECLHSTCG